MTQKRSWHLIYDEKYKYVDIRGKAPLLFHLVQDPLENNNIAEDETQQVIRMQDILYGEM